jgi:succinyl-CoA synthetase alpha subunit
MYRQGIGEFKYYVGISSLAQIATRQDRVCVLNILGGESSEVTPVGHDYSGGNVVFGTSPGRRGQGLQTKSGVIPVYNSVLEGLAEGHRFNCGVIYLPPAAARDGVAELIRVNPDLRKIFIVTEKLSIRDSREIRAMGQQNRIDIFGGNSLGVADAWSRVRIGGALGGDSPAEALTKGSIAILSNSGNFTSTIATYLRMSGWGTTTLISSGKDVYIHYAAPEFAFALANDARSKAAVLYVEPGGYYEAIANFNKPVVACVVGRWKSRLTRAVGHAGAMAGGEDDALAKEGWFKEKFGVPGLFTPQEPICSAKGAVVTNIAHISAALTAVMRQNGTGPDFPAEGTTELKAWFRSNVGLKMPGDIDIPLSTAVTPYGQQIAALSRQIGALFPRQAMKDASGSSQMDPRTQVSSLHGVSMLTAAQQSFEANIGLALVREPVGPNIQQLVNVAVGSGLNLYGDPALSAAQAARDSGASPNCILAAAASVFGPRRAEAARASVHALITLFSSAGLGDATDESFKLGLILPDRTTRQLMLGRSRDLQAEAMLAALKVRGVKSAFVRYLESLHGHPTRHAVLAAIATTMAWGPLMRKRLSRLSAENLPWWISLISALLGASVTADRHEQARFCGLTLEDILGKRSLTEVIYIALLGSAPDTANLFALQTLMGLLLTNGPGAISVQGAKGAVSADGPENPARVQLNKAMVGFLSHCGFAHGGNGFEGISFLIRQFRDSGLQDPAEFNHGIDLKALAAKYVQEYARYKAGQKTSGNLDISKIPGVNHPVFKDRPVNTDPREVYVRSVFRERREYNIFHDYYHALVQELFDAGVSKNVYCVNIDAVIAALLLKILWRPFSSGALSEQALETAAFTVFLYPRMVGCAAESDDHLNRGRNMDTRTPASLCTFVA